MSEPADEASLVARRRRQVVRYVALVLGLSFAFQAWMIKSAGGLAALGGTAAALMMWIPALVAFAVRLLDREGMTDVGWRAGPWRFWVWAYAAPLVFASFTYGAARAVRAVAFVPHPGAISFPVTVIILATVGVFIANLSSLGEELGWRGYLLTRLVEAKLPAPLWLGGIIWGVWHLPLILWGDYATSGRPILSALLFMICVTLAGVFFGWLRLVSGSVWPAVIAHSSHNVFYQAVYGASFEGPLEPFLAGEQGVFSILAYGAIVFWLWQTGRLARALREPVLFARPKTEASVAPLLLLTLVVASACGGSQAKPEPSEATPAPVQSAAASAAASGNEPALVPVRASTLGAELAKAGVLLDKLPPLDKLPEQSIKPLMELMSKSVGLECTGCHVSEQDFETETPKMRIARRMWTDFVQPHRVATGPVFCDSCHNGSPKPLLGASRKVVTAYMQREYAGKLTTANGEALTCVVCHGDPFVPHVITDVWKLER